MPQDPLNNGHGTGDDRYNRNYGVEYPERPDLRRRDEEKDELDEEVGECEPYRDRPRRATRRLKSRRPPRYRACTSLSAMTIGQLRD